MNTKAVCPFCGEAECCGPAPVEVRRLVQSPRCHDREMDRITERIQRLEAEINAVRAKLEDKP